MISLLKEQNIVDYVNTLAIGEHDEILLRAGISRQNLNNLLQDDVIFSYWNNYKATVKSIINASTKNLGNKQNELAYKLQLSEKDNEKHDFIYSEIRKHINQIVEYELTARLYGYGVIEFIYNKNDEKIGLSEVINKPLQWFEINRKGLFFVGNGGFDKCDVKLKYYVPTWEATYLKPNGQALLSMLFWSSFAYKNNRNFFDVAIEKAAIGNFVATGENTAKLLEAMSSLINGNATAVPLGTTVTSHVQDVKSELFKLAFDEYEKTVARLIIGQVPLHLLQNGSRAAFQVETKEKANYVTQHGVDRCINAINEITKRLCILNKINENMFWYFSEDENIDASRIERDIKLKQLMPSLNFTSDYLNKHFELTDSDYKIADNIADNIATFSHNDNLNLFQQASSYDDIDSILELYHKYKTSTNDVKMEELGQISAINGTIDAMDNN